MSDQAPSGPPEPKPIPIPDDFPVTWEDPGDAHLGLELDLMHFPDPIPRLEYELFGSGVNAGLSAAHDAYGIPLHMTSRHINHYFYSSMVPVGPPEEMGPKIQRAEETVNASVDRLEALWTEEWLPEIKEHITFWNTYDLAGSDLPALTAHLDETYRRVERLWEVHFLIVTPVYAAINLFDELYRDLFGDEDAFQALRLLQGFDNKSLETDRGLWELSRKARQAPEVCRIIGELPADEVRAALKTSDEATDFIKALEVFLTEYGQRGPTWGLSLPSWIEDPAPAINILKDYITQDDRDPMGDLNTLADSREKALAGIREQLKGYPQPVAAEFESRLKSAQLANVLTEDHGFWLDFSAMYGVRRVLVEVGQRLADAGVIEQANDVFELSFEEAKGALNSLPEADYRATVVERRNDRAHFAGITAPPRLGMDYGPPPPSAFTQTFIKFFGLPPQPAEDPDVLNGAAGSPGKVRSTARVVHTLADADRLQKGDILVTGTTSPPWTPLFAIAGGIVTDTGGILSHCAVVAREYRIPAVVGTGAATTRIQDGQILEVDGDAGVVRIVS